MTDRLPSLYKTEYLPAVSADLAPAIRAPEGHVLRPNPYGAPCIVARMTLVHVETVEVPMRFVREDDPRAAPDFEPAGHGGQSYGGQGYGRQGDAYARFEAQAPEGDGDDRPLLLLGFAMTMIFILMLAVAGAQAAQNAETQRFNETLRNVASNMYPSYPPLDSSVPENTLNPEKLLEQAFAEAGVKDLDAAAPAADPATCPPAP